MVATRLGWSALARRERVEGHRERWEDVVAIVARDRPETIGRTSRTHGTCGTTTSSRVDELTRPSSSPLGFGVRCGSDRLR